MDFIKPLAIFLFGFFFKLIYDFFIEISKRKQLREDFIFEVQTISTAVLNQSELFKKDSLHLKSNEVQPKEVSVNYVSTFKNLEVFSRSEVRKAFVRGSNENRDRQREVLNKIYDLAEGSKFTTEVLKNFSVKHTEYINGVQDNMWNPNLVKIQNFMNDLIGARGKATMQRSEDEFLFDYYTYYKSWESLPNPSDVYVAHLKLIVPLKELCKKYQTDKRALELNKYLIECSIAHKYIYDSSVKLSQFFDSTINKLSLFHSKIAKHLDLLK